MREAVEAMSAAERELGRNELAAGEAAQQRALEAVRRARDELADRARKLRDAEERVRAELAEAQRRLADRAAQAEKAARALDAKSEDAARAAADAAKSLGEASQSMSQAGGSMSQGDSAGASSSQSEAGEALERAEQALKKAAGERTDGPEAAARLKELKAEQEAIRRQLKDLEDLLKKAEEEDASSAAQGASAKMEETEDRLQSGSGERASKSAEEARRYLEEAKRSLEKERRRYESLRQEEALFRLLNDLKEFKTEQERIRAASSEMVDAAAQGPLIREKKKKLRTLGGDQTRLAERLDERRKSVEEENSLVFSTGMALAATDMAEIARMLEDARLDAVLLGLQAEVVHGLSNLIAGFEDEIERRRQPNSGQGQGGQGGQGKPPLVPPVVEIKFLRRLQNDLNAKIESFWRDNPSVRDGRIDERQKKAIERLFHQQQRLADNLERLSKSVFGAGEGGDQ
jgi:hypothetical protein